MSYYAIGIGGTGGKCLEALIHLAACGIMPSDEPLYILFVDKDGANGNVGRSGTLLKIYDECRANRIGGTDFLKTPLKFPEPYVWSPVPSGVNNLHDFVGYSVLSEEFRLMCDVLYSPEERKTPLDVGFRGHPSIGAAFMASTVDLKSAEPWKAIQEQMLLQAQNKQVKLMLFGSIFGGTGASGFPTIARLLNDWKKDFKGKPFQLGGALMLPYFSFQSVSDNGLKVDAKDFSLSTQAALRYYYQQNDLDVFDTSYLIGSDDPQQMRASALGGNDQENDPHWAELYAALAAVEFFADTESQKKGYHLIAREQSGSLKWTDLPSPTPDSQPKILQMARFAFAFLSTFDPMILNIAGNGNDKPGKGNAYRAPWYVDFFEKKKVDVPSSLNAELKKTREYCMAFLLWLASIEYSVSGEINDEDTNLLNFSSFAEEDPSSKKNYLRLKNSFVLDGYKSITHPDTDTKKIGLSKLWERMCETQPLGSNNDSSWLFINELYRQCGK
jgi:hypothetical protein